MPPLAPAAEAQSDRILRDLQQIMFAYDVGILKRADRLEASMKRSRRCRVNSPTSPRRTCTTRAPERNRGHAACGADDPPGLARAYRSRFSHFREDYEARDDQNWLAWIDITDRSGELNLERTPIPTPLCSVEPVRRPARLKKQLAVGSVD